MGVEELALRVVELLVLGVAFEDRLRAPAVGVAAAGANLRSPAVETDADWIAGGQGQVIAGEVCCADAVHATVEMLMDGRVARDSASDIYVDGAVAVITNAEDRQGLPK